MNDGPLLEGRKNLIVDDEPDVLETLKDLLSMCETANASSFDRAKERLETDGPVVSNPDLEIVCSCAGNDENFFEVVQMIQDSIVSAYERLSLCSLCREVTLLSLVSEHHVREIAFSRCVRVLGIDLKPDTSYFWRLLAEKL